jgi:nitrate reductase NapAB chaperone NapD
MTICSLVVQVKPKYLNTVNKSLNNMDGVEIHAQNEHGKMVLCIDHPDREYCSKLMTEMTRIKGVMSTSLVYEYQEDLEQEAIAHSTVEPKQIQKNIPDANKAPSTKGYTI